MLAATPQYSAHGTHLISLKVLHVHHNPRGHTCRQENDDVNTLNHLLNCMIPNTSTTLRSIVIKACVRFGPTDFSVKTAPPVAPTAPGIGARPGDSRPPEQTPKAARERRPSKRIRSQSIDRLNTPYGQAGERVTLPTGPRQPANRSSGKIR